jgi:hypothetical protein
MNAEGLNDMFCFQSTKRLLTYYNVMTMTAMLILNNSSSLKEKQDDRYDKN